MSIASSLARRTVVVKKEDQIGKNINQFFKERELKMTDRIIQTIWDDKLKVYKNYRRSVENDIRELEKDR